MGQDDLTPPREVRDWLCRPCACPACDRMADILDEQGVPVCRACDDGTGRIDPHTMCCDARHHGYHAWDG